MSMNVNNNVSIGVGFNTNLPQREAAPQSKQEETKEAQQAQATPNLVPAEEVDKFHAQQAAINKAAVSGARTYDVAKYVTPEQAQRIAGFITSFEDIVAQNLEAVTAELGDRVSESVRMNVALNATDRLAG